MTNFLESMLEPSADSHLETLSPEASAVYRRHTYEIDGGDQARRVSADRLR